MRFLPYLLPFLTVILSSGIAEGACRKIPQGRDFRDPVEVKCVDGGTVGFLAPGLGDFTHRVVYSGSPSFVSVTENVDWRHSVFSIENKTRFAGASSKAEALRGMSFRQVLEAAVPKFASSREELDRIVQARCVLFTSSNVCKSAFGAGAAISCSGSAEAIAGAGSDRTTDQEKVRVILGLVQELGVEHFTFAAFFAVLRYAAPSLVEPVVYAMRGYYLFQAGDETYGDMRDVREAEKASWFQAFVKAQKNREMEQYCYSGADQFKHRIRSLYYSATAAYKTHKKAANPAPGRRK